MRVHIKRGRVTLELVSEDGSVLARGQATTELLDLEHPAPGRH